MLVPLYLSYQMYQNLHHSECFYMSKGGRATTLKTGGPQGSTVRQKKGEIQGTLSVKSFNYSSKFMLEQ